MEHKKIALVVGGSRGIGRQIAIDLAANDYSGRSHRRSFASYHLCLTSSSRRRCKVYIGCGKCQTFPPRSELSILNHKHSRTRDSRVWRKCIGRGCRHARFRKRTENGCTYIRGLSNPHNSPVTLLISNSSFMDTSTSSSTTLGPSGGPRWKTLP